MKRIGPEDLLTVSRKVTTLIQDIRLELLGVTPEVTFPLLVHSFVPSFLLESEERQSKVTLPDPSAYIAIDATLTDGYNSAGKSPALLYCCFADWPGEGVFLVGLLFLNDFHQI
jgi:hypothetical protein